MSLFQKSVLKNYLKAIEDKDINEHWQKFTNHFHNLEVQATIKKVTKEEEYQAGFLRDLFVNVFGYTFKPEPNYNLVAELKNVTDGGKADGAILKNDDVIGVIELKGTNTTNLDKVVKQAFGYKDSHPNVTYIIISNFEKLRFYIDNKVHYIEFNLFELSKEDFKLLWLCLAKENIYRNLPKEIKEESLVIEEKITKKLYKDYSNFKNEIFHSITKNNPEFDKLTLYKKTQKLLDRFLFVFFSEDRGLIRHNSISLVISDWKASKNSLSGYRPLFDNFRFFFNHLDKGFVSETLTIFGYNGGLFAPDEILNTIKIDDDVLLEHTQILSKYDFESDVDVNILGHIFEHSLNEIEEITAELKGEKVDTKKTKRKKDGVFYTPKYITKYIVENTVGKLCEEQKTTLEINEEDYAKDRKGRKKETLKKLQGKLEQYRNWLLALTICDPACGSGAFLNQALDFLINEHRYIDELQTKLLGGGFVFPNVENSILENNLFGVDINDESVDIAKLSLWLRTAQKGRKLTTLNNNIKCGNSLIDDVNVAGEKAFDWEKEFPKVFKNGGFDVVIGNPPYVRIQGLKDAYPELTNFYEQNYFSATGNYDIYVLFLEKAFQLINQKGLVSFILPHKFLISDFGIGIRKFFKKNKAVEKLIHFGSEIVFKEAATYTCIINLNKTTKDAVFFKKVLPIQLFNQFDFDKMNYSQLSENNWDLQSENTFNVIEKLKEQPYKVESIFSKIFVGIQTGLDAVYVFEGEEKSDYIKGYNKKFDYHFEIEKGFLKPFLGGKEIHKYNIPPIVNYVVFPYLLNEKGAKPMEESFIETNFPKGYDYLKHFEKEIREREKNKMDIEQGWFLYTRTQNLDKFHFPKIMTREISLGCNMTFDETGKYYHNTKVYSFIKKTEFEVDDKFFLGILNSSVMWFFIKNTGSEYSGGYYVFKTNYIKPFPLPSLPSKDKQNLLIRKVDSLLTKNKELVKTQKDFIDYLQAKHELSKVSKKLNTWYLLDEKEFLKELKKAKVKVEGMEEFNLLKVFKSEKEKALKVKSIIDQTNKEIDNMVYELYGLTKEEIQIVENS